MTQKNRPYHREDPDIPWWAWVMMAVMAIGFVLFVLGSVLTPPSHSISGQPMGDPNAWRYTD